MALLTRVLRALFACLLLSQFILAERPASDQQESVNTSTACEAAATHMLELKWGQTTGDFSTMTFESMSDGITSLYGDCRKLNPYKIAAANIAAKHGPWVHALRTLSRGESEETAERVLTLLSEMAEPFLDFCKRIDGMSRPMEEDEKLRSILHGDGPAFFRGIQTLIVEEYPRDAIQSLLTECPGGSAFNDLLSKYDTAVAKAKKAKYRLREEQPPPRPPPQSESGTTQAPPKARRPPPPLLPSVSTQVAPPGDWSLFMTVAPVDKRGKLTAAGVNLIAERVQSLYDGSVKPQQPGAPVMFYAGSYFELLSQVSEIWVSPTPQAIATALVAIVKAWSLLPRTQYEPEFPNFVLVPELVVTSDPVDMPDLATARSYCAELSQQVFEKYYQSSSKRGALDAKIRILLQTYTTNYVGRWASRPGVATNSLAMYSNIHGVKRKLYSAQGKVLMVGEKGLGNFMFMSGLPYTEKGRTASMSEDQTAVTESMMRRNILGLGDVGVVKAFWTYSRPCPPGVAPLSETEIGTTLPHFMTIDFAGPKPLEKNPNMGEVVNVPLDGYRFSAYDESRRSLLPDVEWKTFLMEKSKQRRFDWSKYRERLVSVIYVPGPPRKVFVSWADPMGTKHRGLHDLSDSSTILSLTDSGKMVDMQSGDGREHWHFRASSGPDVTTWQQKQTCKDFKDAVEGYVNRLWEQQH